MSSGTVLFGAANVAKIEELKHRATRKRSKTMKKHTVAFLNRLFFQGDLKPENILLAQNVEFPLVKTYFYLSFHRLFPISNRPLESRSQIVRQRKFSVEDKYSQ